MAGAKHFRDLVAWQLSRELARAVYALLERPAVQRSFAFRNQLDDAVASPSRNIAEGFRRFRPRDFSRFLTIAAASIAETENHLEDGVDRKFWSHAEIEEALTLCKRAGSAIGALQRYPGTEPTEPSEPKEPEGSQKETP
jgi:four helix bundle protein